MLIIAIEATESGQHYFESQSHRTKVWMEGYVAVPPERESEVVACIGYGDLTVNGGQFVDFVPHPEWIPEPEQPEPSTDSNVWDELDKAYQEGYSEGYTEGVNTAYDQ